MSGMFPHCALQNVIGAEHERKGLQMGTKGMGSGPVSARTRFSSRSWRSAGASEVLDATSSGGDRFLRTIDNSSKETGNWCRETEIRAILGPNSTISLAMSTTSRHRNNTLRDA
jgi:hypothetical protein